MLYTQAAKFIKWLICSSYIRMSFELSVSALSLLDPPAELLEAWIKCSINVSVMSVQGKGHMWMVMIKFLFFIFVSILKTPQRISTTPCQNGNHIKVKLRMVPIYLMFWGVFLVLNCYILVNSLLQMVNLSGYRIVISKPWTHPKAKRGKASFVLGTNLKHDVNIFTYTFHIFQQLFVQFYSYMHRCCETLKLRHETINIAFSVINRDPILPLSTKSLDFLLWPCQLWKHAFALLLTLWNALCCYAEVNNSSLYVCSPSVSVMDVWWSVCLRNTVFSLYLLNLQGYELLTIPHRS